MLFCTTFLFSQNKITSFPYEESFETGLGDWVQSADDVFDWSWNTGATPSSDTGPISAFDGSYYVYTEASSNFNNDTYLDASFDFSELSFPYLTFYYHMNGVNMGSLHVDVWDGTWNQDVFVLTGQQQTSIFSSWKNVFIDLKNFAENDSIVVRLRGITGQSFQSDICIDKIEVFEGTDMSYISNIVNQPLLGNLSQKSTDNIMAVIEITTDGFSNPIEVNSFNINSTGSDDFNHDVDKINVFYTQTDSIFSTDSLFGSSTDLSSPISGSINLSHGKTYFWVTYEITKNATPDNKVDIECTNIEFIGSTGNQVPTNTNTERFRSIEPAMTYISGIVNQPFDTDISQNSTDNIMAVIEITTDEFSNPLEINGFNINSTGSDDFSNDISKVNIFYTQTDSVFSTDSLYASATDLVSPVSGSIKLAHGKNYFWVTYDITKDASPDNKVNIECTNIAFNGVTSDQVPTSTNAERFRSIQPAMTYSSSICNQPLDTDISQNSTDNILAVIEVTTNGYSNPLEISSFNLTSVGSDDFANDVNKVNIYYTQTDSIFSTDSLYGSTTNLNTPISGLVELDPGKNYFWVTYNITEDATPDNKIDVECIKIAFNETTGDQVPTNTNAERFRSIEPAMSLLSKDCFTASTDDVMQNRNDFEIIGINIQTENPSDPISLSEIKFKPTGSDNFANDVSKINIYYTSNSAAFNTDSIFGTANANDTIVRGSQKLEVGDNYFWIAYDLHAAAKVGNKVDAECHYVMIDDVKYFPTDSAPAGNRKIAEYSKYYNFMPASIVVGQPDFYTQNQIIDEYTGFSASSSAVSSNGILAAGSQGGGRILIWNSVPDTNGTAADVVVGSPDFYSSNSGPTASFINDVEDVCFSPDGNKLIASDGGNNRVLIWNSIPTTNGQPADVVIGQTDFTSSSSGLGPNKFSTPWGVFVTPDGKLIIGDRTNNRFLVFNQIPTANGASADIVIGQPDMYTNSPGCTVNKMSTTTCAAISPNGKLLLSDRGNHRILIYNKFPAKNGASADIVIGQKDFITGTEGLSNTTFNVPVGITISPKGELAVGDFSNSRVLIFKSIPTKNNAKADYVLGQPDFNSNAVFNGGVNEKSMSRPYGINFDLNGRLFVNGRDMHRVMIYGELPSDSADIQISIAADKTNPHIGETISYTFTLSNNGPNSSSDIVVKSAIPGLFKLENYTAEKGEYQPFGGTWNIPFIASGESVELVLDGTIRNGSDDITAYSNIVASSAFDGNMDNNAISLTIDVINEPPTITDFVNDTIVQGNITDWIPFTVNDTDTDWENISLSANSSDQSIVNDLNIQLDGENENRFIKLTPFNTSGAVDITVTVSDGYNEAQSTFELYILSNNANLSNLDTTGITITGFRADSLSYTCELPIETTTIPTVTALAEHLETQVNIYETDTIPGITTIEVIAEDGITINNYLVTFTLPVNANEDASLIDLQANGITVNEFSPIQYNYTVNLPYGTIAKPTLTAIAKNHLATVNIDQALFPFPKNDTIEVVSENNLERKLYVIEYNVAIPSNNNNLQKITVDGNEIISFDPSVLDYSIEYPYGTTTVPTVIGFTEDANANITQTDAAAMPGTTTLKVNAEDETLKTYTIEFTIAAPSSDATIAILKTDGSPIFGFDSNTYSYDIVLEPSITEVPVITAIVNQNSATLVITKATSLPGTSTIVVTAQDGTTKLTYNINFTYRPLSTNSLLSDLKIDEETVDGFDPEVYSYTVKFAIDKVLPPLTTATVYDAKSTLKITNATEIPDVTTVTVTAEDGSTSEYQVNFIYLNSDATLSDIKVDDSSITEFDPSTLAYTVELDYGTTVVPEVTATLTDVNAVVTITDATELSGTTTILVMAEDGVTSETYEVEFSIADPSTNATLSNIKVNNRNITEFNPATLAYSVKLAYGTTVVPTVTPIKTDANAKFGITNATDLPGITKIVVTAEDETTTLTYEVNFTIAPNTDATLSDLKVDGTTIANFDPATLSYNLELDYGTITVPSVIGTPIDSNANADVNDTESVPGKTTIKVTAEDGTTSLTYEVNFTIAPNKDATLSDLRVDGTTIANFNPVTLSYNMELDYGTTTVPVVTAVATDINANVNIIDATALPGKATIMITAEDGVTTITYEVNFTVAPNNDATLTDIKVDDNSITEFDPTTLTYNIELDYGTTDIPVVTAIATDVNANVNITETTVLPGKTSILVTAEDGVTTKTYEVNFTITDPSTDATLSDLKVDGTTITGFGSSTISYNIELASGTTIIPTITATSTDVNADVIITDAASLPGTSSVVVTAEDGITVETYSINFNIATSIDELDFDRKISLYPNPTDGIINLSFNFELDSDCQIEVFNSIGSLVYIEDLSKIDKETHKVDLSKFSKGIYFVKISTSSESSVKNIIIK